MDNQTDEWLATAAREGDSASMNALLSRYESTVLQYAKQFYSVGGGRDDIMQEEMIGLYRAVLHFDANKGRFKSFALLFVKRQIINAIRTNNSNKNCVLNNYVSIDGSTVSVPSPDPEARLLAREAYEEMKEKSKRFSGLERAILKEYLKGKTYSQIATDISRNEKNRRITEKSVDNAIQRIRGKLNARKNKK
ncbi:MAG: sigma-70 family RNA polymerase sigma factor [Clostridiales bacterium]|nr:sigma-70 family RNA polymerase sigma factor [Clostridiales bacterium]